MCEKFSRRITRSRPATVIMQRIIIRRPYSVPFEPRAANFNMPAVPDPGAAGIRFITGEIVTYRPRVAVHVTTWDPLAADLSEYCRCFAFECYNLVEIDVRLIVSPGSIVQIPDVYPMYILCGLLFALLVVQAGKERGRVYYAGVFKRGAFVHGVGLLKCFLRRIGYPRRAIIGAFQPVAGGHSSGGMVPGHGSVVNRCAVRTPPA